MKKKNEINYLAKQDDFVLAEYDFKLETSKLLFACLYKMNAEYIKPFKENEFNTYYLLDFQEIKEKAGIDYDLENDKRVLDRLIKDLTSKIVKINTPRGSIKYSGIIKTFDVKPVEKTVLIEVDNDIKPYLIDEFKRFTKLGFKHLSLCKSKYTFRLYEILIMKSKKILENKKVIKFSVEEIRDILQFPKTQGYGVFKNRVLESAKKEYNAEDIKNTDEKEQKKLFKSFECIEITTKQRGKGRNPVTEIIFEFELLEETKLLMMSKLKKIKEELKNEDWIIRDIRILLDNNMEREPYFKTLEINFIYAIIIQMIEDIKKQYNILGNLNQRLIKYTIDSAFNKFNNSKGITFIEFLKNGFVKNCDYSIGLGKELQE